MTARVVPIVEGSRMLLEPVPPMPSISAWRGATYEDVEAVRARMATAFDLFESLIEAQMSALNENLSYPIDMTDLRAQLADVRGELDGRLMVTADGIIGR